MSHKVNLVRVFTAATGNSTPITLGAAYSQLFMTPAEAGAMDGRVYTYLIVDGNDWEMGRGAYTASGTSLARTTIIASRISGTLGTSRITLTGTAQVRFIEAAEDMDGVRGTRPVTSTSDVLANSDQGYVVTYSNASAIAVSLAQAGSSNLFLAGWATMAQNLGAGAVTITPSTSTINGAATLTLATGMGAFIWSDGTNYRAYFIPASKPLLAANNLSDVTAATARSNIGAVSKAGDTFTSGISVRNQPTYGYSTLISGDASSAGYNEYRMPDGTRAGYIGASDGSYNYIFGDNGRGWRVSGTGANVVIDNVLRVGTEPNLGVQARVEVKYDGGGAEYGMSLKSNNAVGGTAVYFFNSSGTGIGSITISNTATAYNTTSDWRLKPNAKTLSDEDALIYLRNSRIVEFTYLGETTKQVGVLAHEQQVVTPWAITGEKDAVEKIGTAINGKGQVIATDVPEAMAPEGTTWVETGERPVYQCADYSKLVAVTMAAVKALIAENDALKARVTALESHS